MTENVRRPIWVVRLDNLNKRSPKKDKVIVRAETRAEAIATARANSIVFRSSRSHATAYIADPVMDLGMTKTPPAALRKFKLMGYV